jgi:hypothetical protein
MPSSGIWTSGTVVAQPDKKASKTAARKMRVPIVDGLTRWSETVNVAISDLHSMA